MWAVDWWVDPQGAAKPIFFDQAMKQPDFIRFIRS